MAFPRQTSRVPAQVPPSEHRTLHEAGPTPSGICERCGGLGDSLEEAYLLLGDVQESLRLYGLDFDGIEVPLGILSREDMAAAKSGKLNTSPTRKSRVTASGLHPEVLSPSGGRWGEAGTRINAELAEIQARQRTRADRGPA